MKYKAMATIQGMLSHNWNLIQHRKKMIVVPSHEPYTIRVVLMATDTRYEGA